MPKSKKLIIKPSQQEEILNLPHSCSGQSVVWGLDGLPKTKDEFNKETAFTLGEDSPSSPETLEQMVKAVVETSKIRKTEKKVAPALVSALKRKNSRIKGRSISGLNDQVYLPLKVFKKQSNQKIGMKEVISSNPPQLILSQKSKFTFLDTVPSSMSSFYQPKEEKRGKKLRFEEDYSVIDLNISENFSDQSDWTLFKELSGTDSNSPTLQQLKNPELNTLEPNQNNKDSPKMDMEQGFPFFF